MPYSRRFTYRECPVGRDREVREAANTGVVTTWPVGSDVLTRVNGLQAFLELLGWLSLRD